MDNLTWYRGRRLREHIDNTQSGLTVSHLAVVMILAARDQGITLEDVVQELIQAQDYDAAANKIGKEQALKDLGY